MTLETAKERFSDLGDVDALLLETALHEKKPRDG